MANKMKQYKIDRITTDPKFELLISPLGAEELAQLEANIRRDGIRDPLVVWPDGGSPTLLDGHNRLAIIRKINAEAVQRMAPGFVIDTVPVEFLKLPTREDAELWIAENQLGRRNLTDDQRAMLAADVLERRVKISRAESAATARAAK